MTQQPSENRSGYRSGNNSGFKSGYGSNDRLTTKMDMTSPAPSRLAVPNHDRSPKFLNQRAIERKERYKQRLIEREEKEKLKKLQ